MRMTKRTTDRGEDGHDGDNRRLSLSNLVVALYVRQHEETYHNNCKSEKEKPWTTVRTAITETDTKVDPATARSTRSRTKRSRKKQITINR